jgi:hypothetical protein
MSMISKCAFIKFCETYQNSISLFLEFDIGINLNVKFDI